jgi:hypothetical protein
MSIQRRVCNACGKKHGAAGSFCQGCKSIWHHAHKRIKNEGLIVDTVLGDGVSRDGKDWWIWDKKGDVLVMGKPSKGAAIKALAFGDDDNDEAIAAGKTPAQLDREIAASLAGDRR